MSFLPSIAVFVIAACCPWLLAAENRPSPASKPTVRLALLLDTSGSMDGLLVQAQAYLWKIVAELSRATYQGQPTQFELALYEYGNDRLAASSGYITHLIGFTTDLDSASAYLFTRTTNGGKEHCPQAIVSAAAMEGWATDTASFNIIIIAGNEPFAQGPVTISEACHAVQRKNIAAIALHCGSKHQGESDQWPSLATCSNGFFGCISASERIDDVATPYDDSLAEANIVLNGTSIPYGNAAAARLQLRTSQDKASLSNSMTALSNRLLAKSCMGHTNASWDAVELFMQNPDHFEELMPSVLPDSLKNLTAKDRRAVVARQAKLRTHVIRRIASLAARREDYLARHRSPRSTSTMDEVVIQALRRMAKDRGFFL